MAVKPSEGEFRAPISGEVVVLFDTGHAVSIKGDNGAEIIVHIGLDTVQLKGQHFTAHVKQGDRVQAGDLLITADLEQIRAAGYDVITPVIICNTPDFPDMDCHTGITVKAGRTGDFFIIKRKQDLSREIAVKGMEADAV